MDRKGTRFKDRIWVLAWLDTALETEKKKYAKCPVMPDMVPGHEAAQGWGYVVAGYALVEQSLKALLHLREKDVPARHSLSKLFDLLEQSDQTILREYYADYRATADRGLSAFPFDSLDDFLRNLDGGANKRGDHIGSFDWRYFLIEEHRSQRMPLVSVDYLHEVAYGCIRTVDNVITDNCEPRQHTSSLRMRNTRMEKYHDWMTVRMNSSGWKGLGDRLEILWGPDYRGRYDLFLFQGHRITPYFSDIPKDFKLPIVDKRKEVAAFDVDEGYRSIGVTRHSPRVR